MIFQKILNHLHRSRILGLLTVLLLALLTIAGLAFLSHGIADYHFAFSAEVRKILNVTIIVMLLGIGGYSLYRILKISPMTTARLADAQLNDERGRSLSATYLASMEAESPMHKFHLERSLDEAAQKLQSLPLKSKIPAKAIALSGGAVLGVGVLFLLLKASAPESFSVVWARVLNPSEDLAPYSPLQFEISPGHAQAVYQGDAMVQVEISGGEVTEEVFCLIRNPNTGLIEKSSTFRETPTRFAKKFENTLEPLEFAFATGRARSDWHHLDVLFEPRISGTRVKIVPPAYTGQAPQEFSLESAEVKALDGSTITLTLESNRPLSGGLLSITSLNQSEEAIAKEIAAELTGKNQVTFTWTASRSSKLSALVRDIRSTPAEAPLELTLKALPDLAPQLSFDEPQPTVLATPRSVLPMKGNVEDDIGLASVSMTRTLVGYRDRNQAVAEALTHKDYEFEDTLSLEPLGVEPGQTLEFYLEASDRNPSLLGIGVSELVRVHIISEEDYAKRIRSQFQLEQFTARYRALAQAIQESRDALKALKKSENKAEFERLRKEAMGAHTRASELALRIADDFKAFELEEDLKSAARAAAETLDLNIDDLENLSDSASEADIEKLEQRLGGVAEQAEAVVQDAELARKLGAVLEMAAEYKRLLHAQQSIVMRLEDVGKQIALGEMKNANQLNGLSRLQEKNRKALIDFAAKLRERADALPEEAQKMKDDVAEFLEDLARMDIPDPMQASADGGKRGDSSAAYTNALLAYQLMQRLLDKPENVF